VSILKKLRREYHEEICKHLLAYRKKKPDVPNIADKDSPSSSEFARRMVSVIGLPLAKKELSSQTIGCRFSILTKNFIEKSLLHLSHLRPGKWIFSTAQGDIGIAAFDQYNHLFQLQKVLDKYTDLKAAFGGDYLITPDIIVARRPEPDSVLNASEKIVDASESIATLAPLREGNVEGNPSILLASISCKWTMRSDRAQNTRTEALNLIRNRKGNTPHIMAVTFEPLPSRLASIALGTGDLDCTYHVALHELRQAIRESKNKDSSDQLDELINGRRLRDIGDLPLDLAV